ncbi:MAG: uroporphyrinogen decarboxylase family protein [Saccharofermentanales bacterium]
MNNRTRFKNVMKFKPVDRLPFIEWAQWWDKTIDRWKNEGLDAEYTVFPFEKNNSGEIREELGLDMHRQYVISVPIKPTFPGPRVYGAPWVSSIKEYRELKQHMYPDLSGEVVKSWSERYKSGEMIIWLSLAGFFHFPRKLLGIEPHLFAFYDNPELLHMINNDLVEYNIRIIDQFSEICVPDFMTIMEDMSYNHGPMISEKLFDEFLAPYYKKIVPVLQSYDIEIFIDSDGDVTEMVPWFERVGIDGFLPLERQAGVDINYLRSLYPRLKIIGGFDKMTMSRGEEAMRKEFARILPVMRQGGYIPSVDHQTPPEVSFDNFQIYVRLLKEYCVLAAKK